MSIDPNKINKINDFMNEKYLPLLKAYEISEEELENIMQKLVNNLSDESYLDMVDTEDYRSLINMATSGGIVYKENDKAYYKDINEALITSVLGSMAGVCKKNGIEMDDYSLGNSSTLPSKEEEMISNFSREDYIMFFTGNALAFHNKQTNNNSYEEPKEDVSKMKEDLKEDLKSLSDKLKDLKLDDIKPKKTL